MNREKCKCQNREGKECGKEMTQEEIDQDGMCNQCADMVWNEMTSVEKVHNKCVWLAGFHNAALSLGIIEEGAGKE